MKRFARSNGLDPALYKNYLYFIFILSFTLLNQLILGISLPSPCTSIALALLPMPSHAHTTSTFFPGLYLRFTTLVVCNSSTSLYIGLVFLSVTSFVKLNSIVQSALASVRYQSIIRNPRPIRQHSISYLMVLENSTHIHLPCHNLIYCPLSLPFCYQHNL